MKFNLIVVKNDYKKEDKHPDYLIKADKKKIGALWLKDGQYGKFMSGMIDDETQPESKPESKPEVKQEESDCPF